MPGFLIDTGTTLACVHGGLARSVAPSSRVRLSGQPAVTQAGPLTIDGCPLPTSTGGPCVSAQWLTGAKRVMAGGVPVVLEDSIAVCSSTGTTLTAQRTQTRVRGT